MINFGDSNLIVQYIQSFLKDNYDKDLNLSGEYDITTHYTLINYLLEYEIVDAYTLKDGLLNMFTLRDTHPPYTLIDGGGLWNFDFEISTDKIRFYSRPISQCFEGALHFMQEHFPYLERLAEEFGWTVSYKTSLNIDNFKEKKSIEFILNKTSRKQLLPSKNLISMINFSTNNCLIEKCFLDENNAYHGFINDSKKYKIIYIPTGSDTKFTIAHGYKNPCEIAIGYTDSTLNELKNENLNQVYNIVSFMNKSTNGELKPEDYYVYEIPKFVNCTYLLIQMPYEDKLISPISQKVKIKLGDINQDGIITYDENDENSDYSILKDYVYAIKNKIQPKHNLSKINLIAANLNGDIDINGNPIIDENDLKIFELQLKAIENGKSLDFGEAIYEKEINLSESDYNRLLVIYGDITENNENNELNIPIYEFQEKPWAVHECFIPYVLGTCIHSYSKMTDIEWLQETVMKINTNYTPKSWGTYDSPLDYLSNKSFRWNESKNVYEYFENGYYSGYILSKNDIFNSDLIKESNLSLSNIKIKNGRIIQDRNWTGEIVLLDGKIGNHLCMYSLREIVKQFQIQTNKHYKNQSSEQIKFINGFVDPLTEKRLKQITNNL